MNYERDERIAIRMDSGMSEREAIALTDSEIQSKSMYKRVAALAEKQRSQKKPAQIKIPTHAPILDRKTIATGEKAESLGTDTERWNTHGLIG
jgi:uncharacterized protein YoaH (UPF0181 family)